ncbi:MAG: hypothetical protein LBU74_08085 [Methanobacteriaceae archaeon]|jgi:hypothetical protein|nr:hypothetical protein [Candidatus Methanorudis spinitermitis]
MEVFRIFEYNIKEVIDILANLKKIEITEEKIRETRHSNHRFGRRSLQFSRKTVYNSLIHKTPVGISKSNYNTFKIIHEHPRRKSQDIYIIIAVDEDENVKLITVYSHNRKRRVRT